MAVDLGLWTGVAVFGPGQDGLVRLRTHGSTHLPSRAALRRAAPRIVADHAPVVEVVVEGDRDLAKVWERAARHHGAGLVRVSPEQWRERLLWPRERTPSTMAKAAARDRAAQVIAWSRAGRPDGPRAPTGRLRSDTADAIMVGLFGVVARGWVDPADLPFPVPTPPGSA